MSPGTPRQSATSTPRNSSCLRTPDSSRTIIRKVARTPTEPREETEAFDSLLESFVLEHELIGGSRDFCTTAIPGTELEGAVHSQHESLSLQTIVIKLEDLLSNNETGESE